MRIATVPLEDPDVQLMLRFSQGDSRAFQDLFAKYSAAVVNFAFQYVGSRARAEEIAQDVFVQVFRWRERYRPKARFSTWLFRIARNHCLNELRRGEYRVSVETCDPSPDEDGGENRREPADPNPGRGEDLLAAREAEDTIRATLARLPPNQRAALVLSRMEGLSYAEAAQVLGCSEKAIKSLVFRATQSLREALRDFLTP